ncbi:MAG: hypothetical protein ACPGWR_02470 [Ardenticatenaceae bacterium]
MSHDQSPTDSSIPLARLDLYNEAIILTKFGNQSSTSYPVSIHDLSAAFGTLPASSGFLPRNTLFHGRKSGQEFVGIYLPAKKQVVTVGETTIQIPLPSAIFIGCGKQYSIHAVKQYPSSRQVKLYCYPSPNVWNNGHICAGDTPFPTCNMETIVPAFKLFIKSQFNLHLVTQKCKSFPNNIVELWKALDGQDEFPHKELVPSRANYLRTWV